ncbi:hypothetical protein K7432_007989 [Basidiobolus ranarum]|uniref:LOV domain-containing protein n=1 Tax=Basidiobolus ranarum TaxID=34480 RepID=A0ABR2WSG6_9FUNG
MKVPKYKAPVPVDEDDRIKELLKYKILETTSEEIFDDATTLAAQICETPVALISFLATERCFFKSRYNTNGEPAERDVAFCSYVVASKNTFIVTDATTDPRFVENPSVLAGEIRFYAGAPLTTKSGHVLGSLCVIDTKPNNLDVNQQKALEVLARHVVRCLELRLHSITLDKAKSETKTFFANAEAERQTSIMKTQFLANMSHEIRTPIHGIVGCLEILRGTPLTEEQAQLLETMQESIDGISRLTNDILDISKIETEQLTLESTTFNPAKVFDSIRKRFQLLAARKQLNLNISVPAQLSRKVVGDAVRFDEIISNIVNNAIKFTEHGSVSVIVEDQSNNNAEVIIFIQVIDTGIGIPPNKMDRVFTRFSQVDESHKRRHGGSGLSLSITKFLVEKMNGTIGVKSTLGEGTKFWIVMSFAIPEENLQKLDNDDKLTALIVEDNAINRQVLCKQISCRFSNVQCVENGLLAVEACKKTKYSVIFMDCQMPVMDGYEATTEIRKFDLWTPIIAVSANTIKSDIERCFQVGMNAHLSKPVRRDDIMKCVHTCLMANTVEPKQYGCVYSN